VLHQIVEVSIESEGYKGLVQLLPNAHPSCGSVSCELVNQDLDAALRKASQEQTDEVESLN